MSDKLPAAVDVKSPLSADELGILRTQYEDERAKGWVSTQTKFNYAWGLVKSDAASEVSEGVALLMEIYRDEANRRRECLYFLSVGQYKLGNYAEAKRYNDVLLSKEPSNLQAQSLRDLIDKAVTTEGYVGLALAGGAATVAGILFAAFASTRRK